MKIKCLLLSLVVILIPATGMATDEKSLEMYCDDIRYDIAFNAHHDRVNNSIYLDYILGEKGNRGKYKYNMLADVCDAKEFDCSKSQFGRVLIGLNGERSLRLNMVAYALDFNNIEVFETLILNKPELKYLIDSALYKGENKIWCNEEFMTPALIAIEEGQVGVLKYLIKNYNVNLLKRGGYMYRRAPDYIPLRGKGIAEKALDKWTNKTPDKKRKECAEAVLKVVEEWYRKNENDKKMNDEADKYNKDFLEVVSQTRYMIDNIDTIKFTPYLDIFKLQSIEKENFTDIDGQINSSFARIDKQIDILVNKIMRDFDFSAFGNSL